MEDVKAKKLIGIYDALKASRRTYEHIWQDIRDLVRPGTSDFQRKNFPGDLRSEKIYDSTAPQALEELAAGLHSFLTSPTQRWFNLEVVDMDQDDHQGLEWLESVADAIYREYSREASGFNSALQECYMDIGAFGTSVVNQEFDNGLLFRTFPLSDTYLLENARGKIDTLIRKMEMTLDQIKEMFPDSALPDRLMNGKVPRDRVFEVLHMVLPRRDRDFSSLSNTNMAWASHWVLAEPQATHLKEGGYRTFPYATPRWSKLPNEVYGRGPTIVCLPDIRMLNRMELTNIRAVQKAVDPPLMLPNDGFLLPIKTSPGSLNFKEPGTENIEPMEFSGQWQVAIDATNQKRDTIRQCFYADWLRMQKENVEMTAFEVADRRDEKLRFLAPKLGRLTNELLGPMIVRSYELLFHAGRFPEPPGSLGGRELKVVYTSPAAKAQGALKMLNMNRFLQDILPLREMAPQVFDVIDWDGVVQIMGLGRDIPRGALLGPEEVADIRAARDQQAEAQQLMGAVEPASKALLNVAKAQSENAA